MSTIYKTKITTAIHLRYFIVSPKKEQPIILMLMIGCSEQIMVLQQDTADFFRLVWGDHNPANIDQHTDRSFPSV